MRAQELPVFLWDTRSSVLWDHTGQDRGQVGEDTMSVKPDLKLEFGQLGVWTNSRQ